MQWREMKCFTDIDTANPALDRAHGQHGSGSRERRLSSLLVERGMAV